MSHAYAKSQLVLGGLLTAVGVAIVATTVAGGGGPLSLGMVVGVSFAVLGAARIWLARQRPAGSRR